MPEATTFPGPPPLGRGAVIAPGAPPPFDGASRFVVDEAVLADPAPTVGALHRCWAQRQRVVIELAVDQRRLAEPETATDPPYRLGSRFELTRERLHFLVWANTYDCRSGTPVWWHAVKAEGAGFRAGGPADVVLSDGFPAWIDSGPRQPLPDLGAPVIHRETIELGRHTPIPPDRAPGGDLAPDQREAVAHARGSARVIAPAGSGKTRTLTARIRHLLVDRAVEPELVTAVAYNTRAAEELRNRLPGLRPTVRTIHSLGWWVLRQAKPDLAMVDERQVRRLLEPLTPVQHRPNQDVLGPYLEALAEVRIALRPPDAVELARDDVPDFARVFAAFRDLLRHRLMADFDEQVYGAIEVLLADPALRRRVQAGCRHLLVDEFQDLTPAYLLLLRLVAAPGYQVFGVGDDDQVIYGYAGADPGFLIEFDQLFPGAGHHALEVNYRSPAPVVRAAATLLEHNRRRVPKTIRPPDGRSDPPETLQVRLAASALLGVEAATVVAGWLADGIPPGGIAVLCRVNDALLPVQGALAATGIPLRSTLHLDLLSRTGIRAALAYLRIALTPDAVARADLLEAVRRPSRGLNQAAGGLLARRRRWSLDQLIPVGAGLTGRKAASWDDFVHDLRRLAAAAGSGADTARLLRMVRGDTGLDRAAAMLDGSRGSADRAGHGDDLEALEQTAALHPDPAGFEGWLRQLLSAAEDPKGVTLSSVHRVKGMEWPRVLLFRADRDLMPHRLSDDHEEERRVFHVAITRGIGAVALLADQTRPSPFIAEMTRRPVPQDEPPSAVVEPASPRAAEPPPDPNVLDRLREWRRVTAAARNWPAYLVLHDKHLEELARRRPRDMSELARCPGIGPVKLDLYGEEILEVLGDG